MKTLFISFFTLLSTFLLAKNRFFNNYDVSDYYKKEDDETFFSTIDPVAVKFLVVCLVIWIIIKIREYLSKFPEIEKVMVEVDQIVGKTAFLVLKIIGIAFCIGILFIIGVLIKALIIDKFF